MKRFLLSLIVFFVYSLCFSQEKIARVTLKTGTTITGTVKDFNPATYIILDVAGYETQLNMADVASIEGVLNSSASNNTKEEKTFVIDEDTSLYPEKFDLQIGPYVIGMILIKGDSFSMGYDGRGSLKYKSEPVHPVALHSFYVNAKPLSDDLVRFLKRGKEKHSEFSEAYTSNSADDIAGVVELLDKHSDLSISLISEAQWEYIATKKPVVLTDYEKNLCLDYLAPFMNKTEVVVDPIGPRIGKARVVRTFTSEPELFERLSSDDSSRNPFVKCSIRITFPASQLAR